MRTGNPAPGLFGVVEEFEIALKGRGFSRAVTYSVSKRLQPLGWAVFQTDLLSRGLNRQS